MLTDIDELLKADFQQTVEKEFPEFDFKCCFREMTAQERINYRQFVREVENEPDGNEQAMAAMALMTMDDGGKRIFNKKRIEKLINSSYKLLNQLFDAASEVNGISAEALEEAKKKLNETPN